RCSSAASRSMRTACRSSWSSRTPVAASRSVTAGTCSTRARTPTPVRATSCSTIRWWSSCTSAPSPAPADTSVPPLPPAFWRQPPRNSEVVDARTAGRQAERQAGVVLLAGFEGDAERVAHVAVDTVDVLVLGADALLDHGGEDTARLLEPDDDDAVGVLRLDLVDLRVEGLRLRVVDHGLDDLAAGCLERLREVLGESGAVRVVQDEQADRAHVVLGDDLTEHLALEDVGRCVTEVQALVRVGRQLLRRVRRCRALLTGAHNAVDHVERHGRRRRADDRVDVR